MLGNHRCVGDPNQCQYAAICETCGARATEENPVVVEGDEFECQSCRSKSRHEAFLADDAVWQHEFCGTECDGSDHYER